eukprot:CAMPEP_0196813158 /NCGR_PEP_ID=MMETSP1362-20130617/34157_1 /TAXON_ID=163516 /ORGANISM="Leptocylindrus danicus, Strain CCMP1856" /LENGTH=221 /DNA_ID=CAMNT_0042189215 /DNA_START=62 /DNA_END=727 /DNA_ORIENTATION=-
MSTDDRETSNEISTTDKTEEPEIPELSLKDITSGKNERGIPAAKFIEDIDSFSNSFTPSASAELLIGAFSDLFSKYKQYEMNLTQKRLNFQNKIPEIEKSLKLVQFLKQKKEDDDEPAVCTRYNLSDMVYANAELDCSAGIVNLWLGANVMLEYTYDEAIDLLSSKLETAKKEQENIVEDLAFTRDQIITAEVNMSRVYNWDVRVKREKVARETANSVKTK